MPPSPRPPGADAPAAAHLGWGLRAKRAELALNREQIASILGYSVEVIKRVELGTYPADLHRYVARWAEVYGLDDNLRHLWSRVRAEQLATRRDAPPIQYADDDGTTDDGHRSGACYDLLEDLADEDLSAALLLLPVELVAFIESLRLPEMDRRRLIQLIIKAMGATSGLVVLEDDSLKRLAHALTQPSATDAQTVSNVEARTTAFHKVEERLPARLIRTSLTTHLDALSYLLINGRFPDPIRRRLMSTAGEATVLAGWLAFDLKDSAAANRLYALAIDAARNVGDDALFACALAYMSYAASAKGDVESAIQLLEVAQRHAKGDRYAATRAWLSGREAEEQASLGNSVAALRALEVARTEFEQSHPTDERSWTNFFDDARLKSLEIHTLTRLGLSSKARTAAIEALAGLPNDGVAKKHSIVLADIATAQLQLGNLDEACELAARALEHAQLNECSLAIERLRRFGSMLRRWGESRAATEVTERLRSLQS